MIRPRPTNQINGTTSSSYFNPFHTIDVGRSEAYCPCGARLSKYRALGDVLCAPCALTKTITLEPAELHPPVRLDSKHQRWRSQAQATCPHCAGPMDRRSKTCKHCV